MSITIQRIGQAVQVLEGADTLPEGRPVKLFTCDELQSLEQERLAMLAVQMPSFLRGDDDEDASELFFL
jgi:hypothetical protein